MATNNKEVATVQQSSTSSFHKKKPYYSFTHYYYSWTEAGRLAAAKQFRPLSNSKITEILWGQARQSFHSLWQQIKITARTLTSFYYYNGKNITRLGNL